MFRKLVLWSKHFESTFGSQCRMLSFGLYFHLIFLLCVRFVCRYRVRFRDRCLILFHFCFRYRFRLCYPIRVCFRFRQAFGSVVEFILFRFQARTRFRCWFYVRCLIRVYFVSKYVFVFVSDWEFIVVSNASRGQLAKHHQLILKGAVETATQLLV